MLWRADPAVRCGIRAAPVAADTIGGTTGISQPPNASDSCGIITAGATDAAMGLEELDLLEAFSQAATLAELRWYAEPVKRNETAGSRD